MAKYKELSYEELEKNAYHILKVKDIFKLYNPFKCWIELEKEITLKEIQNCLNESSENLTETPLFLFGNLKADKNLLRENHIRKIAFFVKNGFDDPIQIDVGLPEMGHFNDYLIEDGNHRLAAAIFRNDENIKCIVTGSEEYAKSLKFWNPNDFQKEIDLRDDIEMY